MPLPLIPVALLLAGALGVGAKKGYDGVQAMQDAKRLGEEAEARHRSWVGKLDASRQSFDERLRSFEEQKQLVVQLTFSRLIRFLERIDQKSRVEALASLGAVGITRDDVRGFVAQHIEAGGAASGAVTALLTGWGASTAATTAVTAYATASTGAAISGLSGAAANSAVAAWLGGGTLAAGGGGVAAGSLMLGGIAIAPAIAVGGFVLSHQGEKARTKAQEYAAEVDRQVAKLEAMIALLSRAERRVEEMSSLVTALDERASRTLDQLWLLVGRFDTGNDDHVQLFATTMQLAKALSQLLRISLFTADGEENLDVEPLLASQRTFLGVSAA